MPALYWLLRCGSDVPADNHWLTASERERLETMRFAKRRADWRLGRWTAKQALAAYCKAAFECESALTDFEIFNDADGAPHAYWQGRGSTCSVSISHRGGAALCAVAEPSRIIGCDLELIEQRSAEFVADYFTTRERRFVETAALPDRACITALVWSAKESAMKALAVGLRIDTRALEVSRYVWTAGSLQRWQALEVRDVAEQRLFHGWWCARQDRVLTLLATNPVDAPVQLS